MIEPFPNKKYKIIYADPPWQHRNKGNIEGSAFKQLQEGLNTIKAWDVWGNEV